MTLNDNNTDLIYFKDKSSDKNAWWENMKLKFPNKMKLEWKNWKKGTCVNICISDLRQTNEIDKGHLTGLKLCTPNSCSEIIDIKTSSVCIGTLSGHLDNNLDNS